MVCIPRSHDHHVYIPSKVHLPKIVVTEQLLDGQLLMLMEGTIRWYTDLVGNTLVVARQGSVVQWCTHSGLLIKNFCLGTHKHCEPSCSI